MSWFKKAQHFYDPDDRFQYDEPEVQEDLPVVTPENVGQYMDEGDQETFLDEIPEDFTQDEFGPVREEEVEAPHDWQNVNDEDLTPDQKILKAIDIQQCLMFDYFTLSGAETGTRITEPYGDFVARTTGNHILVTWDRHRQAIRAFCIDNMSNIKILYGDFYHHNMDKFVFRPA